MPLHVCRRAGGLAAWIAAAGVVAFGAAFPAVADAQIYIAGPGAHGDADAAQMNAAMTAPKPAAVSSPPASSLASARPSAEAAAPGMITIPGPGERIANAQAGAPNVVTIPAPGEPLADRVAQVVVNPATNGASMTRAANVANLPHVANVANIATVANAAKIAAATGAAAAATTAQLAGTSAPPVPPGQENGELIRAAALSFLQQQSTGLPGHIAITVSPVFPRGLAACTSLETFFPPGARTWGHTTVGVRCVGAKPWTLYVAARVAVDVTYYLAARPLNPGEVLNAMDLIGREGDLGNLPQTVVTDPSEAVGAVALMRISAGLPLRTDMLRSASSVVIGQTVKLVAAGPNFSISEDGQVLNNAAPGQQVRVRTPGGQIITGVVKDAGTVQVQI
ncbi:MAG TPA: flagellar basal body P-ring formation chaperone FlgA [Paraburkholderia sp.]|jgi:flagella basal body P-ring formation protein FlgA